MHAEVAAAETNEALPHALERHIARRTWGRLRRVVIEVTEGRVTVRGCAPSYYVKQLAIQACLEATEAAPPPRLDVDIVVTAAGLLTAG
jgi:hypothetical protein